QVYVVVRVADALNLLGVLVGDFDAELLLEAHHQLDRVERVGPQVVNEARVRRHLVLVNAQLVNDDLLHFCFNLRIGHYSCSSSLKLENSKTLPARSRAAAKSPPAACPFERGPASSAASVAARLAPPSTFRQRACGTIWRTSPPRTLPGPTATKV